MTKLLKKILQQETTAYLIFGVLTSLVSIGCRLLLFKAFNLNAGLSTYIANAIAILFAFVTNDRYVFKQTAKGWPKRLLTFTLSRLVTFLIDGFISIFFVDHHPEIIGQFVNQDKTQVFAIVTFIAQAVTIILNYIFSKCFVFKDKK